MVSSILWDQSARQRAQLRSFVRSVPQTRLTHDDGNRFKHKWPGNDREPQNGIEHAVTPRPTADRHQGMMTFAHSVAHPPVTANVPKGPGWENELRRVISSTKLTAARQRPRILRSRQRSPDMWT